MTLDLDRHVPFVDLRAQAVELAPQLEEAALDVVRSGQYVLGHQVEAFEGEFAQYCGSRFAVGVDSGTSALELILRALDIGPGDEVITAANSFVATALAISYTGASPVFVDVDPGTRNVTADAVEAALTARTAAIVPVHLYGQPCEIDPLLALARRHGLAVVEDACQAHGARYNGRRTGALGGAAAFSFYPSKNLGALGDGGMVTTSDAALAERVRRLRNYGQVVKNESLTIGYNARLDELQAAMLRVKLQRLDAWNATRRALADRYSAALAGIEGLTLPTTAPAAESVWHLYVVNVEDRDAVRAELVGRGIETGVHYPIPIPQQPAYASLPGANDGFPVSSWNAGSCLSLPMYPELPPEAVDLVSQRLTEVLRGRVALREP